METLSAIVNQFWTVLSYKFDFFDVQISILDIYLTHVIIDMLMDIFLDYTRGDVNGAE